ncbi:ATP11-domain-containing protein [Xylariaceae sp. FL0662B]|nr:ATP11-domain-containing protein [Xylariaceae sp. FL0662B]
MATLRTPALRNLLRRQLRAPAYQRRWAQVHDVRFLATTQTSRNVTEKYREKLDRKAREEGLRDIAELKAAYQDRIQDLKKKDSISIPGLDALLSDAEPTPPPQTQAQPQPTSPDGLNHTPPPPPSPQVPPSTGSGKPTIKPLSAILDLPKARELPTKELSAIWRLRHAASTNSLCAVIPTATYEAVEATARRHPTFVLPLPRTGAGGEAEGGAEIHLLQWVFERESATATVLFTQLAEYKARGEWAQPHTSVTHYWDRELADRQGVVLMAGAVLEGRGASVRDAQWLVSLLQRFYGDEGRGGDRAKRELLEAFGRGDGAFTVERLLEESEKVG